MEGWLRQWWKSPGGIAAVLRVAWPLILSNSFWTLQITLDRVFLSRYSPTAVGAAQAAAILFWTPLTLFQFTANYSTTFVAQYVGANRPHRVGPAVWQALYFSLLAGIAFLSMWLLAEPLVQWGAHSADLQQMEITYLKALSFSGISFLIIAAISGFFAGRGDSRTVLLINGIGVLVNAPLTYAWIFGKWGLPQWGIAGAGWATVVGTAVAAIVALALFFRKRHQQEFHTRSGWRLEGALLRRLLTFGIPSGMTSALEAMAFTFFVILVGRMGTVEMAASSIAITLNIFIYLPVCGIGQAVSVLVGQSVGEENPEMGVEAARTGTILALLFSSVFVGAFLIAPGMLTAVFESKQDLQQWQEVAHTAVQLLIFVVIYAGFDCVNIIYSFALRGAGDTRFVTAVMLICGWPLLVVPTYAAWYYRWGLYWAWTFATIYAIFLALVCFLRFRTGKWKSMRVIEPIPLGELAG